MLSSAAGRECGFVFELVSLLDAAGAPSSSDSGAAPCQ